MSVTKQKLLIIPSWQMWPLHSGGARAQNFMFESLSDIYELHVLTEATGIIDLKSYQNHFPEVQVHFYDIKAKKPSIIETRFLEKSLHKFKSLLPKKKVNPKKEFIKTYKERLTELSKVNASKSEKIKELDLKFQFDFVQYEMDFQMPLLQTYVPKGIKILVLHEVVFCILDQMKAIFLDNALRDLENDFDKYFKKVVPLFDRVVLFNKYDAFKMTSYIKKDKIYVSPYSISIQPKLIENKSTNSKNLVFVGSGFHYPNYQGLEWFLSNVFAELLISFPDIKIYITAKWQLEFQRRFKSDRIIFIGYTSNEELEKMYTENILVCPVAFGSGLRTKIIEGLSMGSVMIANKMESTFLPELEHKKNIMLANSTKEYIQAIQELCKNEILCHSISAAAKYLFISKFHSSIVEQQRLAIYQ
ncbi:MAG: glycosyltransferase [Bacteroidetes bacterium]|nr:glycosyltransferase [Bacteroidota bacterium]